MTRLLKAKEEDELPKSSIREEESKEKDIDMVKVEIP